MDWRPTASIQTLQRRAALLEAVRTFFRERSVLEVETPVALQRSVTDVHIGSLQIAGNAPLYLQTSPEYPMKRLLAAGSGDIFQICRVFRAGEHSPIHNPEFTMIEWYRLGFDLQDLMSETAALVTRLFECGGQKAQPVEHLSYAEAFEQRLNCNPLTASHESLATLCGQHGLALQSITDATRDDLLDFLIATQVGPQLGLNRLTCLHHFPASQAALAKLEARDPRTALRFELYARGVELANGYVELASAAEQRQRFRADQAQRQQRDLPAMDMDERMLAALESGLPPCAGVALGFDRVAMLSLGAAKLNEVMAFPWDRA